MGVLVCVSHSHSNKRPPPSLPSCFNMMLKVCVAVLAAISVFLIQPTTGQEQFYDEADFAKLIGKKVIDGDKVLKGAGDSDVVVVEDLPVETRIVRPGQRVTKDNRDDRLNLQLDDEGVVVDVEFG